MKNWKSLVSTSLVIVLSVVVASAQTNTLKRISFVMDHYQVGPGGSYPTPVKLLGDNIDIDANVWIQTAPNVCQFTCRVDTPLRFGSPLDGYGFKNASGTINGVYYPTLYIFHTFQYTNPDVRIPKRWARNVRISAPLLLTGNIGAWTREYDMGDPSKAVFFQRGINFEGRVKLILNQFWSGSERFYRDKYLEFDFATNVGGPTAAAPSGK